MTPATPFFPKLANGMISAPPILTLIPMIYSFISQTLSFHSHPDYSQSKTQIPAIIISLIQFFSRQLNSLVILLTSSMSILFFQYLTATIEFLNAWHYVWCKTKENYIEQWIRFFKSLISFISLVFIQTLTTWEYHKTKYKKTLSFYQDYIPKNIGGSNSFIMFPAMACSNMKMESTPKEPKLLTAPRELLPTPRHQNVTTQEEQDTYTAMLNHETLFIQDEPDELEVTVNATLEDDDDFIFVMDEESISKGYPVFTAYKRVDKKVHPVSTSFPMSCHVERRIPEDPLLTLPPLPFRPPEFTATKKISDERMNGLNVNATGFIWPEEEKLFQHIMVLNEAGIAFQDSERGTFKESYFSPYIIPTVPHVPWEHTYRVIPPGLLDQVLEVLKLKIAAGVYEQSQSAYRSQWFVIHKKTGKLRIVHDLQPLNKITIRDAGMLPIIDDFVEGFAGYQCYTVFDLFWGFDARKIHPQSRDLTAFMTPLGLLQITSLPTGFTNSPAEFQKCMTMILHDEIPHKANIFIDDLPIKGPKSQYLDQDGKPEVLKENPGIRRFIWEHAQDVHRIMHKVTCAGATFAAAKAQICLPEVLIVGQICNAKGRSPDTGKVDKILSWPPLKTPKDVRRFLGLCGTIRIWIPNYSSIVRPLTELYHHDKEFIWDERRQETFDYLKKLVAASTSLRSIDYKSSDPIVLSVDSSKEAAGLILSQDVMENGRKIRYPSRYGSIPMSERESRYSQPKLELFGLYRALRHWRLYIIGAKKLKVEVDAKYIKGMLNEPDLQPNAAINRWIQGILTFDFELVHVPADRHKGPDALSRRPLAEGEKAEEDDDSWLDSIALLSLIPSHQFPPFPKINILPETNLDESTVQVYTSRISQEQLLEKVYQFLHSLSIPKFEDIQSKRRFIAKAGQFFIKESDKRLYKRNGSKPPLLVVFDAKEKLSILLHAHENLGHKGFQAVFELL